MWFCWSKHIQRLDKQYNIAGYCVWKIISNLLEQNNRNCISEYLTYWTGIAIDVGYYIQGKKNHESFISEFLGKSVNKLFVHTLKFP